MVQLKGTHVDNLVLIQQSLLQHPDYCLQMAGITLNPVTDLILTVVCLMFPPKLLWNGQLCFKKKKKKMYWKQQPCYTANIYLFALMELWGMKQMCSGAKTIHHWQNDNLGQFTTSNHHQVTVSINFEKASILAICVSVCVWLIADNITQ